MTVEISAIALFWQPRAWRYFGLSIITLGLLCASCERKQATAPAGRTPAAPSPADHRIRRSVAAGSTPRVPTPKAVPPLKAPPLLAARLKRLGTKGAQELSDPTNKSAVAAILKQLRSTYHDPLRLGLKSAAFTIRFSHKRNQTSVEATGRWVAGEPVRVRLAKALHRGQPLRLTKVKLTPGLVAVDQKLVARLNRQLKALLVGFGRSFLSRRFAEWEAAASTGEVYYQKGGGARIVLALGGDHVSLLIDEQYKLRRASRTSGGVIRGLRYQTKTVDGRHLVQGTTMWIAIDDTAKLNQKTRMMMRWNDKTTYALRYADFNGILLPSHIERDSPQAQDRIVLDLDYLSVER